MTPRRLYRVTFESAFNKETIYAFASSPAIAEKTAMERILTMGYLEKQWRTKIIELIEDEKRIVFAD
jgi:hypothetical protein